MVLNGPRKELGGGTAKETSGGNAFVRMFFLQEAL